MAKMFYTLQETADKLGVSEDTIKNMATSGRLQQFRDRDKLMFKREQVDGMAAGGGTAGGSSGGTAAGAVVDVGNDSGGPIPLADSGDTDAIDLKGDTAVPGGTTRKEDPREATGVSVFDADEVEPADPSAQTQVAPARGADEELAIETVGSGSGLLDLTRESDDTSLGAELLDEIYPGGEASDAKVDTLGATAAGATATGTNTGTGTASSLSGAAAASSGVFDGAIAMESGPSGLDHIVTGEGTGAMVTMAASDEVYEPGWSGITAGLMVGVLVALGLGLMVGIAAILGSPSAVTASLASDSSRLMMVAGGMLVLCAVLGIVGGLVGKMQAR